MRKAGLNAAPQNYEQIVHFFEVLKSEAEEHDDVSANMIYQILYTFVSSVEVRDRHTSPRIFEDIFSSVFNTKSTDTTRRENPSIPQDILRFDRYTRQEDWAISTDLSSNKREKADACIGNYLVSLKTLKGVQVNKYGKIVDDSFNDEINVGSFSYRALFKGVLTDQELNLLGDRKNGLGSRGQIRRNVLDPIKNQGKGREFLERLKLFFGYVYAEDVLVVIKSDYRMKLHFIPNQTFVDVLCLLYENNEPEFQNVWHRWENNNLRFKLTNFFNYIDYYKLPRKELVLNLASFANNTKIMMFNTKMNSTVINEFNRLINKD